MELSERAAQARPIAPIPDHLNCIRCRGPLINGFHTNQGARLCKKCVETKLHPTILLPCVDIDDSLLNSEDLAELLASQETCVPDTGTRRELSLLPVHCLNNQCLAELQWKDVDEHLAKKCDFEVDYCPMCSRKLVVYQLHGEHKNLESANCCPKYKGQCPHCLDPKPMSRAEFVNHRDTCPAIKTQCIFHCVGCSETMQRSELNDHCNRCTDKHLEQTVKRLSTEVNKRDQKFSQLSDEMAVMQARLARLEKQNEELLGIIAKMESFKRCAINS